MKERHSIWIHAAVVGLTLFFSNVHDADAQEDNITVYADMAGTSCSIEDRSPATLTLFVLHRVMYGAVGANLRVTESAGFSATFVSESIPHFHVGTFRDGVTVAYEECVTGPFLIGTIMYQGHGTSSPCSELDTSGNPNWFEAYPLSQNCSFEDYPAPSATPLYINPSSNCFCTVRAESNSWGRVKALYRR